MPQGRPQDGEAVPAAARRAGEVDDQRPVADARDSAREQAVRRLRDRICANRLRDPRRRPLKHLGGRLGRHVAGAETGAAGRQDQNGLFRELHDRVGDGLAVVGDDAPLDLVTLSAEQLRQDVAAAVLPLAGRDTVGDGQDGGLHTASFVFSSKRTSLISISLSIAFAMSYTVSAATETAVKASISTPVCALVSTVAEISTTASPTLSITPMFDKGNGWHSGISSAVRFAAMIPATWAVASASPFGRSRSRRAVSGAMRTSARATARRRETSLPPTSTIRTAPVSSTCESSLIARTLRNPRRRAVELVELRRKPMRDVVFAHVGSNRLEARPPLLDRQFERFVKGLCLRRDVERIDHRGPVAELLGRTCVFG